MLQTAASDGDESALRGAVAVVEATKRSIDELGQLKGKADVAQALAALSTPMTSAKAPVAVPTPAPASGGSGDRESF